MIIAPIRAFNDNYIWMIKAPLGNACVVVDPGDAEPVLQEMERQHLSLSAILLTHHHPDHVGGVKALCRHGQVAVYGPASCCTELTEIVEEQSTVAVSSIDASLSVMTVPGHTLDHVAYFGHGALFCGDTLFSAGCGRVFEGTYRQMYQSILQLNQLPGDTRVYPAHEYTLANLAFARQVEPENAAIVAAMEKVTSMRASGLPSLPTTLAMERAINPFLRCEQEQVKVSVSRYAGGRIDDPIEVFAALRQWKDGFKADD